MQRHAEVNSNYFSSIDFDIINADVHAFFTRACYGYCHEACRTLQHRWLNVGYNLDQTATILQLLCLSNKISEDSFKRTYTTLHTCF